MSDLVPFQELQEFINTPKALAEGVGGVLELTLDQVEEFLLEDLNRNRIPFQVAEPARSEIHDGTGSNSVWLDYPIAAVTDPILLGHDPTNPEEELDPTDPTEIVVLVGDRRIRRVGGGGTLGLVTRRRRRGGPCFGPWAEPGFVHVTYDTDDDLPGPAKLAVIRGTTLIYNQRGVEETKRHRLPDLTLDLKSFISDMPEWRQCVKLLRRHTLA